MEELAAPRYRRNVKDVSGMTDAGRRRREAASIKLREERRAESMQKKRAAAYDEEEAGSATAAPTMTVVTVPSELKAEHIPAYCAGELWVRTRLVPGNRVHSPRCARGMRHAAIVTYCAAIRSSDAQQQLEGVVQLRRFLSKDPHPPVADIIETGILPILVSFLSSTDTRLQFESAWAITNIASTDFTAAVVEAGAVGPLAAGLVSGDANVREQCLWCLGNIVGDCVRFRDMVIYTPGAVHGMLLNIMQPSSQSLLRNAAWALSNFCRGKPSPSQEAVAAIVPALAHLLTSTDKDILADACWGINYLTDNEKVLDTVLGANLLGRVVELMSHSDTAIQLATLRIIGNFISGTAKHTQAAIDAGALRALTPLLGSSKRNIRREATWAVSNVAAGTKEQITILLTLPGIMPAVLHQLKDSDWNIRKEAAWVVCNVAAAGTADHVRQLVAMGVIPPLNDVLSTNDPRMLCVVLDAITAILTIGKRLCESGLAAACDFAGMFEEVGVLTRLEELQDHDNADVCSKCVDIIEKFYGVADGDENAAAPATPQPAAQSFMAGTAEFTTPTSFKGFGSVPAPFGVAMPFNVPAAGVGAALVPQQACVPAAMPAAPALPLMLTQAPAIGTCAPALAPGYQMPMTMQPAAPIASAGGFDFSNVAFV